MADWTGGARREASASGMRQEMQQNCTEEAVKTSEPTQGGRTSMQVRAYSGRFRNQPDTGWTAL